MKKGALVIALFLVVAQSSLVLLLLRGNISLRQYITQQKIAAKEKKATDTLLVSPEKIIWEEEHECWIDGKLYDVLHSSGKGNKLELIAYHDHEEQKAKERYAAYLGDKPEQHIKPQLPPDWRIPNLFPGKIFMPGFAFPATKPVSLYQFVIIESLKQPDNPPPRFSSFLHRHFF